MGTIEHLPSSRCGVDHDTDPSPLSYGPQDLVMCLVCHQEFIQEGDTLVPVAPAPEDYDHDAQPAQVLDRYWGRLMDGTSRA